MEHPTGLLVNGRWREGAAAIEVLDKYTLKPFARVAAASPGDVDDAVAAAREAARNPLSPAQRAAVLRRAADYLAAHRQQVIETYVAETGFTLKDAEGELNRAIQTILLSAEEATRLTGETVPVEATPGSENRLAFTIRVPVGVVAAIAPFNAPLNTVAHKIAPALAAGNGVVLKPATVTPLCSVWLCRAFQEAGLPPGFLNMVVGSGSEVGARLVEDSRVRYITFTGSTRVGLWIKQRSGIAKTHMELGSNSATIVCEDARLDKAVSLIVRAGYRKAGQVCTSVQRLLVQESVYDALLERLVSAVRALRAGDPRDPSTDVGPMISPEAAARAEEWVQEAVSKGAQLLAGGTRHGAVLAPTLLARPAPDTRIMCDEIFAPVVAVIPFQTVDEAVDLANNTSYGLQAGVFTQDIDRAMYICRRLQVGGVMINDTSSYHADLMPYGGVKDSGYGLEGPRYAVQDMTDPRIIVLNLD